MKYIILGAFAVCSFACDKAQPTPKAKDNKPAASTESPTKKAEKEAPKKEEQNANDKSALLSNIVWKCTTDHKNPQGVVVKGADTATHAADGTYMTSVEMSVVSDQFPQIKGKGKSETLGFGLKALVKSNWTLKGDQIIYNNYKIAAFHNPSGIIVPNQRAEARDFLTKNKDFDTAANKATIKMFEGKYAPFVKAFKDTLSRETSTIDIIKLSDGDAMFKDVKSGATSKCKQAKKLTADESKTAIAKFNKMFNEINAAK